MVKSVISAAGFERYVHTFDKRLPCKYIEALVILTRKQYFDPEPSNNGIMHPYS